MLNDVMRAPNALKNSQFLSALIVTGDIDRLTEWVATQERQRAGFGLNLYEVTLGLTREQALAAVALATVAFNSTDPYSDKAWLALGSNDRNDWKVSRAAANLLDDIGYESWEDILHKPPGHAAILTTFVRNLPDDYRALANTLSDIAWTAETRSLRRELLDRMKGLAGSDPSRLAQIAGWEASQFNDAAAAEAALAAGGAKASDYDITAVRSRIARARLKQSGYDAASAQAVAAQIIEEGPFLQDAPLELLASLNATAELRRIGETFHRTARADRNPDVDTAMMFAGASDSYRLAGDAETAIAIAREGVKIIPQALIDFGPETADPAERRRMAGEDNGMRTAPALALFRAGAEDEALASNYLAGRELLQHWSKPLDQFDPKWLVDDGPKWRTVIIADLIRKGDRAFAARVHEAFANSGTAAPVELAIIAAIAGKRQEATTHLMAAREAAQAESDALGNRTYYLIKTVTAWRAAEMLLANLPKPD